jgi:hypothetical protein
MNHGVIDTARILFVNAVGDAVPMFGPTTRDGKKTALFHYDDKVWILVDDGHGGVRDAIRIVHRE